MNQKKSRYLFFLIAAFFVIAGLLMLAVYLREAKQKREEASRELVQMDTGESSEIETSEEGADVSEKDQIPVSAVSPGSLQQTSVQALEPQFQLRLVDGCLDVYQYESGDLFFHTGIRLDMIRKEEQKKLQKGKLFFNEEELYGYLESCTS